jgi:myo-inositol-1(or 4)-monophosphatase
VASEAGAVVTGLRGAVAGEAIVVAARPPLVAALLGLLEGLDADGDPLG